MAVGVCALKNVPPHRVVTFDAVPVFCIKPLEIRNNAVGGLWADLYMKRDLAIWHKSG